MIRHGSIVALMLMLVAPATGAHELGIARVSLDWDDTGSLALHATIPAAMSDAAPVPPKRCMPADSIARPGTYGDIKTSWYFDCGRTPIGHADVIVLDWPLEGVFVQRGEGDTDGRFIDREEERIVLPMQDIVGADARTGVFISQYLSFGVEHILSGWDHLAFVLALCLIASGWRLVKLVTAFTVGHSITLGLASVGFIAAPAPPLEALIALSIAFMAREAILREDKSQGYGIVLAFGLLHGLGFAGALSEFGLQQGSLLKALLAFNLGVELGQLIFVVGAVGALTLARTAIRPAAIRHVVAHGIGILAVFWTVERIAGFTF